MVNQTIGGKVLNDGRKENLEEPELFKNAAESPAEHKKEEDDGGDPCGQSQSG